MQGVSCSRLTTRTPLQHDAKESADMLCSMWVTASAETYWMHIGGKLASMPDSSMHDGRPRIHWEGWSIRSSICHRRYRQAA